MAREEHFRVFDSLVRQKELKIWVGDLSAQLFFFFAEFLNRSEVPSVRTPSVVIKRHQCLLWQADLCEASEEAEMPACIPDQLADVLSSQEV